MGSTLAGKIAIITGASSGIGRALAVELAAQGCKLGLIARRIELLETLAQEIAKYGGTAIPAIADVSNREMIKNAIASIRDTLGPIDLMIANAGVGTQTKLDPVNLDDVERMIRINLLGVIYSFAAVMPNMLERHSGHLVAVSSIAGYRGLPGESAYCASKAAVNVYLDGLRIHLRGTGVKVTTICPGFVKTPMTEMNTFHMPGLMEADYAARRIVQAIKMGKKVSNFPFTLQLMTKLSRWMPDWVMKRVMSDYNSEDEKGLKPT